MAEAEVSASTAVVSNDKASSTAAPPAGAQVLVAVHGLPGSPPDPDVAIARSSCPPPRAQSGWRSAVAYSWRSPLVALLASEFRQVLALYANLVRDLVLRALQADDS